MLLAIDTGNSNIVLGGFKPRDSRRPDSSAPRPEFVLRLPTHPIGTAAELRARITASLAARGLSPESFEDLVIASVVPAWTEVAREALPRSRVIDHRWPFSFTIGTDRPEQTGIDRLVNAEAVLREHRAPAIIVDMGTATTICALRPNAAPPGAAVGTRAPGAIFLGGAILPGIEACRDALPGRAAQLFSVELQAPAHAIGASTQAALQSGVVLGYASMVDGMVQRFKSEMGDFSPCAPRVIATGGPSALLAPLCREWDIVDPDLTLKGILYLYESLRHR